jgi:hypothetical protein
MLTYDDSLTRKLNGKRKVVKEAATSVSDRLGGLPSGLSPPKPERRAVPDEIANTEQEIGELEDRPQPPALFAGAGGRRNDCLTWAKNLQMSEKRVPRKP